MKKSLSLFCFLFGIITIQFAQDIRAIGQIKGQLYSSDNQAVSYASVSLLDAKNEFIIGTISEEDGAFLFEQLALDTFTIEVQFLGYKTYQQTVILSKKQKRIDLGKITLEEDLQQLEEVVVTADKSSYSLQLDKKVFEVGKDALSQSTNALDILDQVPQVAVDPSGAVTLRGSSAVQILINGKRSGLTLNNALEQIPSDNIARIEVMTNPSARYDASGSAGIINIILKKEKGEGWSGQISATTGTPANHMISPGVNYRGKKINTFASLNWRYSDYVGRYITSQRVLENGFTNTLESIENEARHDDGRSGYFGADFYLNPQNTITLAYFRAETKDTDLTLLNYDLENENEGKRSFLRTGNSVENRNYNQLEANYTHDFTRKGEKWTIDFQYDFWNSNKDWDLATTGDVPTYVGEDLRTENTAGSRDFVLQSDYVRPLNNGGQLEFGIKGENRLVLNTYQAEILADEVWAIYQDIDNDVDYSERIGAAYLQYQGKWKDVGYSVGLRTEYTFIDIEDEENTFTNTNSYPNLFPSATLSYAINDGNEMQLSYSRRIQRPSLWSLYPFFEITDFNSQYTGNPNLQPAFSDAFELSYVLIGEKITFNPNVYFRHSIAPTQYFLERNEAQTFISKPINLEQRQNLGAEFSLRYQATKWLRLNTEFNVFHFDEKGEFNGQNLDAAGTSWSARLNANVNLPKGYQFQTRFNYWGAQQAAQTHSLDTNVLSFGANKSFFEDKFNVNIRAYNVLRSRARRSITETQNFYIEQDGRRNKDRYSVTLTYRFNQSPRQRMRQARRGNR